MATETFTPDNLVAGTTQLVTESVTIVSGQTIVRGAVLGKITTGGKYTLSLTGSSDGSEKAYAIAAEDVDASGGDEAAAVYIKGEFNENSLTLGTGHTIDTAKTDLRDVGINIKTAVTA